MDQRQVVEIARQPDAGDRGVGDLARAEAAGVDQMVADEVERLALHRPAQHLWGAAVAQRQLAALRRRVMHALLGVE